MDLTAFERLQTMTPPATETVSVDGLGNVDRTLAYGYTAEREGWHAYLEGGELHVLIYTTPTGDDPVESDWVRQYVHGTELPLRHLRPDERAYPEYTDELFAVVMANRGAPLRFLPFDLERYQRGVGRTFHAARIGAPYTG